MNKHSSDEKYVSLESALEGWYEKPFDELPEKLKARVKRAFKNEASISLDEFVQPVIKYANQSFYDLKPDVQARLESNYCKLGWDENSPEDRLARARVWDEFHDPKKQGSRKKLWDAAGVEHIADLEEELKEMEAVGYSNASELRDKKKEIKRLKKKISKAEELENRVLRSKSTNTQQTERDITLQIEANKIAKKLKKEKKKVTKRIVARQLAESKIAERYDLTLGRIERLIKVEW